MAEESSIAVQPEASDARPSTDPVEEVVELEEIEEATSDQSGGHRRASVPPVPSGARASTLPVPNAARSGSLPPVPPQSAPLRASSVPPPPPAAAGTAPVSWPPSSSGMFRIDQVEKTPLPAPSRSSAPPPPSGASEPAELKRALAALSTELREQAAQVHRLRLVVRLREDAIRELEVSLRQQRQRADALEQEIRASQVQSNADDLKRVSGIGPGFERALHALGVTSFRQIAEWRPDELERIAREIRTTPRRILRDRWVEHARALVAEQAAVAVER